MTITFKKTNSASNIWMDNKNQHQASNWSIVKDGVVVGSILNRGQANWSHQAEWIVYKREGLGSKPIRYFSSLAQCKTWVLAHADKF